MTEFRHEIPMRWADLDTLNHVNNVVYLRYAADARAAIADLPAGPIGQMTVQFKRPILLSRTPVVVTSQVDGFDVLQSIGVSGSSHEFATVASRLGGFLEQVEPHAGGHREEFWLRRTDLDESGEVSPAQVFELFQETRIPFLNDVLVRLSAGGIVVAQIEISYYQPIGWQAEPLTAVSWLSRLGNSSFVVESQLLSGDQVLASSHAVLVGFDASTQSSRQLENAEREQLAAALA